MRDSQRQKVYNAEFEVRKLVKNLTNHEEVRGFVEKILNNKKVVEKYSHQIVLPISVEQSRGYNWARAYDWGISIPNREWARNEIVVLHELAHVITIRKFGNMSVAAHGREFCEVFLNLIKAVLGKVPHEALIESYKTCKVQFKSKVTREFSPEHRKALRERMAQVRAARSL